MHPGLAVAPPEVQKKKCRRLAGQRAPHDGWIFIVATTSIGKELVGGMRMKAVTAYQSPITDAQWDLMLSMGHNSRFCSVDPGKFELPLCLQTSASFLFPEALHWTEEFSGVSLKEKKNNKNNK